MARRPKDELPELINALNASIDDEQASLLGKDINMDQNELENILRREERRLRESDDEDDRRSQYLQRFHTERENVRKKDEALSHAKRQKWINASKGNLYIDSKNIPANEVWAWVRQKARNQPDDDNMMLMLRKGWVPVRPEECKEFSEVSSYAKEFGLDSQGMIRHGGLVLMKRSKEEDDEEKEYQDEQNRKVRNSVRRLTQQIGHQYGVESLGVVHNETERTTKWNTRF